MAPKANNSKQSRYSEKAISLEDLMRSSWDARIANDYRGWMNDRVENDQALWASGERDFSTLLKACELKETKHINALDLGCGVGRLLRPASKIFANVTGCDISEQALLKAKELLLDCKNISYFQGNGTNLDIFPDDQFDFVYSFGMLSNVPVEICANYLTEMSRVLRPGGIACFQIFLGQCIPTVCEDTAAFRSFPRNVFKNALAMCGFRVENISPLPLEVDTPIDGWLLPEICFCRKDSNPHVSANDISLTLLPEGEARANSGWPGSYTEYMITVKRAEELLNAGQLNEACKALRFAVDRYKDAELEVRGALLQLENSLKPKQSHN